MPESDWSEQQADEPKKGIPMWVWGCGGCGLLTLILLLVGGGLLYSKVTDAIDPDKVWPNVDQVLAFDKRPEGYEAWGSDMFGAKIFVVVSKPKGIGSAVLLFENETEEPADELFSSEEFSSEEFGIGKFNEAIAVKLEVAGRECEGLILKGAEVNFPMLDNKSRKSNTLVMIVNLSKSDEEIRLLEIVDLSGRYSQEDDDSVEVDWDEVNEGSEANEGDDGDEANEGEVSEEGEDNPTKSAAENAQQLVDDFLEPFNPWD